MSNRLKQFREYMARLDAAANPAKAIERGFYVERPGKSVARQIQDRLGLRPSSTHLVVGGVGSGKTTQLLIAQKNLDALEDVVAHYIDVSEHHDLMQMKPGVLILLAGMRLGKGISIDHRNMMSSEAKAVRQFKDWGHGFEFSPEESSSFQHDDSYYVEPRLSPPKQSFDTIPEMVREETKQLKILKDYWLGQGQHHVLLLDSMDRLTDPAVFEELVTNDIHALRTIGIGVVVVGPLRALYGIDRPIADHFDSVYHQSPIDAQEDDAGKKFLVDILRARLPASVLPDDACYRLAYWSGGVLRDLIALAQLACEEAYFQGSDTVGVPEVDRAADSFGRKHLLGIGTDELEVLQRVRKSGNFIQVSEKDLALLVTRRVLEYPSGPVRYTVHPTLRPLLEELA